MLRQLCELSRTSRSDLDSDANFKLTLLDIFEMDRGAYARLQSTIEALLCFIVESRK